ncbi:hypothetical protein PRZ48_011476 [Zasmidium cellare]|uniref:AB hydrolase-1 domain-containing protein n=1 Tax=Zasmidium cellare TaxID=395010 RepID=A0ABR0E6G3_ZASCE|nr:hypothetical protein PRZ48_011476 [Zasmidium cellare]
MWDGTVKALHEAGYSTLRFDHIGHARSPPPQPEQEPLHMDDIARHMREIIAARGCQGALYAIIGCSIGGILALRYPMIFPDEVNRVISICAPGAKAPGKAHTLWSQRIQQFREDVANGTNNIHHATVDRWFGEGDANEPTKAECSADTASSVEELQGIAREIGTRGAVVMEGAGHLPPMQQKDEFNKVMLDFLQE